MCTCSGGGAALPSNDGDHDHSGGKPTGGRNGSLNPVSEKRRMGARESSASGELVCNRVASQRKGGCTGGLWKVE